MSHGYLLAFMCRGCLAIRPAHSRCVHNQRREPVWIDPHLPGQTQECRYQQTITSRAATIATRLRQEPA